MKLTKLINIFAVTIVGLTAVLAAAAQVGPNVEISNISGEKRKICVYNASDKVGVVPKRCFTMNPGEKVTWNRQGDYQAFQVKIFKPQLIDKYLYTRNLPFDTARIIIGVGGRFGFSRTPSKPAATKYILKVCNQRFDQKIYFALAFEVNKGVYTEGWWSVRYGECKQFPVSVTLKNAIGADYGTLPRTYYYARTGAPDRLTWAGGDNDLQLCVNQNKAFHRVDYRNSSGVLNRGSCTANGEEMIAVRRLDDPKTNQAYYFLTF